MLRLWKVIYSFYFRHLHQHHVVTYLSIMEHSQKFSRQITDTLDASVRHNEDWHPTDAADAFLALEKYALNLLDYPWKTEFKTLKVSSVYQCIDFSQCYVVKKKSTKYEENSSPKYKKKFANGSQVDAIICGSLGLMSPVQYGNIRSDTMEPVLFVFDGISKTPVIYNHSKWNLYRVHYKRLGTGSIILK